MVTVAEIRDRECRTPAGRIRFLIMMSDHDKPTYESWCEWVEEAIELQSHELAQRRHTLQNASEDGLTTCLILGLKMLGFRASSSVVNGNCDVVVEFEDYSWLGEAKIDTGVSKVWGGYLQLTQRYGTGLAQQARGGMLVYCFRDSATTLLAEWRAALESQRPACRATNGDSQLTFRSFDTVAVTGLDISVFHIAIPLMHAPVEDTERLSNASFRAARSKKRVAKARADNLEP